MVCSTIGYQYIAPTGQSVHNISYLVILDECIKEKVIYLHCVKV